MLVLVLVFVVGGVKVGVGVGRLRDYQGRLRDLLQNSIFRIDIVPSSL